MARNRRPFIGNQKGKEERKKIGKEGGMKFYKHSKRAPVGTALT